jgi:surfactin synthase thioesterase subunit
LAEPPFTEMRPLIETLVEVSLPYMEEPFAFWGHSMGAVISFELARELQKQSLPGPIQLFVSGRAAPQIQDPEPPIHQLSDESFIEELRGLEGTPEAVLENAELMQLLMPTLRADFALIETYNYLSGKPLDCPICAFGGRGDKRVSPEDLLAWHEQTNSCFSVDLLPGDHFFILNESDLVLQTLSRKLREIAHDL